MSSNIIAIVRVRGLRGVRHDMEKTLSYLNLHRRNFCVVLKKNPSSYGMIQKIRDFVAWGEIREDVHRKLTARAKGEHKFYRLNSPKKGYGRKGIKVAFSKGGALGYRGDKINDLITRML